MMGMGIKAGSKRTRMKPDGALLPNDRRTISLLPPPIRLLLWPYHVPAMPKVHNEDDRDEQTS